MGSEWFLMEEGLVIDSISVAQSEVRLLEGHTYDN